MKQSFTYTVLWQGQKTALTSVPAGLPVTAVYLGQINTFHTDDPAYKCYNDLTEGVS